MVLVVWLFLHFDFSASWIEIKKEIKLIARDFISGFFIFSYTRYQIVLHHFYDLIF